PESEISMIDFLALFGCELQMVIGERTSGLGRVMHPGTRLEYEVRFLETATVCLQTLDNKTRRSKLQQAIAAKEAGLSRVIWNATWGTREIEQLFSRSQGLVPLDVPNGAYASLAAHLSQLQALIQLDDPA